MLPAQQQPLAFRDQVSALEPPPSRRRKLSKRRHSAIGACVRSACALQEGGAQYTRAKSGHPPPAVVGDGRSSASAKVVGERQLPAAALIAAPTQLGTRQLILRRLLALIPRAPICVSGSLDACYTVLSSAYKLRRDPACHGGRRSRRGALILPTPRERSQWRRARPPRISTLRPCDPQSFRSSLLSERPASNLPTWVRSAVGSRTSCPRASGSRRGARVLSQSWADKGGRPLSRLRSSDCGQSSSPLRRSASCNAAGRPVDAVVLRGDGRDGVGRGHMAPSGQRFGRNYEQGWCGPLHACGLSWNCVLASPYPGRHVGQVSDPDAPNDACRGLRAEL